MPRPPQPATQRPAARCRVLSLAIVATILAILPARAQAPVGNSASGSTNTTVVLNTPEMLGLLSFNPAPNTVDTGLFGTWNIDAVASSLGLLQSNRAAKDRSALSDLSNGQIIVQKPAGPLQFYVQAGVYANPTLGTPYSHTTTSTTELSDVYGPVPVAFLKLEPTKSFSIVAGKLPSLYGNEDSFTFQNFNVDRGLLTSQTPSISRGVQTNVTLGDVTLSFSLNDGFYANRHSWLTGSATWSVDKDHSVVFVGGSNLAKTDVVTLATPLPQNNSTIFNLIYTQIAKPFTVTPYLQYAYVPANPGLGIGHAASTIGAAMLASATIDPSWAVAARVELLTSTGKGTDSGTPNLLYGPGSTAFSITLTPTFTDHHFFARADLSLVQIVNLTPGDGFGTN